MHCTRFHSSISEIRRFDFFLEFLNDKILIFMVKITHLFTWYNKKMYIRNYTRIQFILG